ncbi:MAG: acylneuraminate cytidylyltransferase [Nitrosopumilaceae archaeon]|nr:acylneuraminate cytidylyltransferase [Nitrosopumilaceae archaeon]
MIAGIIQARLGSSRLPGKIMLQACGKSMLELMIERVQRSKKLDKIIIATSISAQDDEIAEFCTRAKIDHYRGSEHDLLSRYKGAADKFDVDLIVRLTSDTPVIDAKTIDDTVEAYMKNEYDFVSNCYPMPRTYPDGTNVEVFSHQILNEADREAKKPSEREHVTFFMWMQPERYKIFRVDYQKDISRYRLNLDYKEDYIVLKTIFENLYPKNQNFSMEDALKWLDVHPEIYKINSNITQGQGFVRSLEADRKAGFDVNDRGLFKDRPT